MNKRLPLYVSLPLILLAFIGGFIYSYTSAEAEVLKANLIEDLSYCEFELEDGTKAEYSYEFLGTKRRLSTDKGGLSKVTVYIKNTGNVPFYSDNSGCKKQPKTRLGTAQYLDRDSILYTRLKDEESGWINKHRIKLDQKIIRPGHQGSFTFYIKGPMQDAIFIEFFDVVTEGVTWAGSPFKVAYDVGEYVKDNREFIDYITESRSVTQEDLNGERTIEVDVSDQRMWLRIGDIIIRNFPVSTGKPATPTPYGETEVFQKQEVRVGGAYPHYIMPQWMQFRSGGYGIHALPSLSFDNGYFWTEALNHIGQPRSHGCIRLLPEDAEFTYHFTPIGTKVKVQP